MTDKTPLTTVVLDTQDRWHPDYAKRTWEAGELTPDRIDWLIEEVAAVKDPKVPDDVLEEVRAFLTDPAPEALYDATAERRWNLNFGGIEYQYLTVTRGTTAVEQMTPHLISLGECALIAGVKATTWSAYVTRGQAPAPAMMVGRTPRWDWAEVNAWQKKRSGRSNHTD